MKIKKIILAIIIGICLYFLYLYADNGFKNVSFTVTTSRDSIYMEVYWDGKIIDTDLYHPYGWGVYNLNVFPGMHTAKIKGKDFEEEFSFFVFPLKYIDIEYHGRNSSLFRNEKDLFIVRKRSLIPLMYD